MIEMGSKTRPACGGLGCQEVSKVTCGIWRTVSVVATWVIALAGDLFANWIDPTWASFWAARVVVGSLTSYACMDLKLLPHG